MSEGVSNAYYNGLTYSWSNCVREENRPVVRFRMLFDPRYLSK